jgi:hypothetical protein
MSQEGDLVLLHYQNQPALFARIDGIKPDVKKAWYQVTLLLLTVPPHSVTWILREEYINGAEFTMGGVPMKLQPVPMTTSSERGKAQEGKEGPAPTGKVIPVNFRKL